MREATEEDIDAIIAAFRSHRDVFGFVRKVALAESIRRREVLVATSPSIVGAMVFRRRRDGGITVYDIAAAKGHQRYGIGSALIGALPAVPIRLKCPVELSANAFYAARGFTLSAVEDGKRRRLNVWRRD